MRKRSLVIAGLTGAVAMLLAVACGTSGTVVEPGESPTTTTTAAPREPKKLEAKTTIAMNEMFFADEHGMKGGPFRVPAGKTVGIHIVNKGQIEHEIMFGRKTTGHEGEDHGYGVSLFENVPADVFIYPSGKKVEVETEGALEEIELEPGADVWLRVKFPENLKGTWEIGCFVPGHYEAGMKALFIIE